MILQKNSDYVLELEKKLLPKEVEFKPHMGSGILKGIFLERIINHAKFLKRELQPGMFVPCDESGKPLQEPKHYRRYLQGNMYMAEGKEWFECDDYRKAQEKVLFKNGIKVGDKHFEIKDTRGLIAKDIIVIGVGFKNGVYQTIEDLANSFNSIELTQNAIKEFES